MSRRLPSRALSAPRRTFAEIRQKSVSVPDYFRKLEAREGQDTRVNDPYAGSPWVFAAISHIATPIKEAALEFLDAPRGGEPIEDPTLEQFWRMPARSRNGGLSFFNLIDLLVGLRGVEGQAHIILDDSWITTNTPMLKRPLLIASASRMTPLYVGARLEGWSYRDAGGKMIPLLPEQVVTLRRLNVHRPDHEEGVSPVNAARIHVESEAAGARHAKRVMDRNGDEGQFIIAKGPTPSPAQQEWLLAQIEDKRRAATMGRVKDVVLGGDIEIQTPTLQSIGESFLGQQKWDATTIFNAFCLPTSLIESQASYSIGSASDLFRAMHNVIMPEGTELAASLALISEYYLGNRSLAQEIKDGYRRPIESPIYARFSFDKHPVMIEWRKEQIETASKSMWGKGWSWEAINEYFDLGMSEFPGWEKAYLPGLLVEVDGDADPGATTSGQDEKSAGDLLSDTAGLLREIEAASLRKREAETVAARARAMDDRKKKWQALDKKRAPFRKRIETGVSKRIMDARRETLANLKNLYEGDGSLKTVSEFETRAAFLEIVFDLAKFSDRLIAFFRGILPGAYRQSVEEAAEEIGADFDEDTIGQIAESPRVIQLLKERENYMRNTSDSVHREILHEIAEGVSQGESLDQLSARIRARFNEINRHRANTIAVTETGAVYETARLETFRAAGVTLKGWLSSLDHNVRATHEAAEAKYQNGIPLDSFFEVGEAKLLYPLDSANGADHAEEVIACRCILDAVS